MAEGLGQLFSEREKKRNSPVREFGGFPFGVLW